MALLKLPEEMYKTTIYVLKDEVSTVTNVLHDIGALHVSKARLLKPVEKKMLEEKLKRVEEPNSIIEKIVSELKIARLVEVREEIDAYRLDEVFDEAYEKTMSVWRTVESLLNEISVVRESLDEKRLLKKYIECIRNSLGNTGVSGLDYDGKYFTVKTVVIPKTFASVFKKQASSKAMIISELQCDSDRVFIIMFSPRDMDSIKKAIIEFRGKILNLKSIGGKNIDGILSNIEEEIDSLEKRYEELRNKLYETIDYNIEVLAFAKLVVENEYERLKALLLGAESKFLYVITGWTPENSKGFLLKKIYEETKSGTVVLDKVPRMLEEGKEEEVPPSKIENRGFLKPFELITKLYGMPNYREWDPTPLIAIFFPIFFGFMIGDAIYGIVLFFLVHFVLDKMVENPESEGYKLFKKILYASAIATIIAGVLQASYLGDIVMYIFGWNMKEFNAFRNSITPVPWLTSAQIFIAFSMLVGLIHINIAHILMFAKALKYKLTWDMVNELGLFIAEVFGLPYILSDMLHIIPLPNATLLAYMSLIGVLLIIASKVKTAGSFGAILWLFDLTGILGDVMSYARIAGVGLATYYLAMSFNQISALVYGGMTSIIGGIPGIIVGGIFSMVIFLIGHLMNIVLSSLSGFVHSLRLFFVEFLPKFYEGNGIEFKPLKIIFYRKVFLAPT